MPQTYYDSELTGEQIESALEAIHGVVTPSNNGKILCIVNGEIAAKSASEWGQGSVLEPLSATANGDYTPSAGVDGFSEVHVAVPGATLTTKSLTQNGTYNASSDNADGYSSVTVAVPGGATIEPLSVTQNGTYTPPSGVDGYAPVTVNVSGGNAYELLEYIESDGTQAIDTGRLLSPNSNVMFAYLARTGMSQYKWGLGAQYGDNTYCGLYFDNVGSKTRYYNGSSTATELGNMNFSLPADTLSFNSANKTSTTNFAIFTLSRTGHELSEYASKMRLYFVKLGSITFLPCRRKSDGVCGLWDCTSGVFLTDSLNGNPFVAGSVLLSF